MDEEVRRMEKTMTMLPPPAQMDENQISQAAVEATLDKFDIETRLRQDVTNILEPTFRKWGENEVALKDIKSSFSQIKHRLDECEFKLAKYGKKFDRLDQLDQQFNQFEVEIQISQGNLQNQLDKFELDRETFKHSIAIVNDHVKTLDAKIHETKVEVKDLVGRIVEEKTRQTNAQAEVQNQIEKSHEDLKDEIQQVDYKVQQQTVRVDGMTDNITDILNFKQEARHSFNDLNEKTDSLKENKVEQEIYHNKMTFLRASIDTFDFKQGRFKAKLAHLHEFLDRHLFASVQKVISECLRGVLDKKYRSRLMAYENLLIPKLIEQLKEEYVPRDPIKDTMEYVETLNEEITTRSASRVDLEGLGNYDEPTSPQLYRKRKRSRDPLPKARDESPKGVTLQPAPMAQRAMEAGRVVQQPIIHTLPPGNPQLMYTQPPNSQGAWQPAYVTQPGSPQAAQPLSPQAAQPLSPQAIHMQQVVAETPQKQEPGQETVNEEGKQVMESEATSNDINLSPMSAEPISPLATNPGQVPATPQNPLQATPGPEPISGIFTTPVPPSNPPQPDTFQVISRQPHKNRRQQSTDSVETPSAQAPEAQLGTATAQQVSVGPNQQAYNQPTAPPSHQQSAYPGQQVQAPPGAPPGQYIQTPDGQIIQAPPGAPPGQYIQSPPGSQLGQYIQAPPGAPPGQYMQTPNGQIIQAPPGQYMPPGAPPGQYVQAPPGAPPGQYIQTPDGQIIQAPAGQYMQAPQQFIPAPPKKEVAHKNTQAKIPPPKYKGAKPSHTNGGKGAVEYSGSEASDVEGKGEEKDSDFAESDEDANDELDIEEELWALKRKIHKIRDFELDLEKTVYYKHQVACNKVKQGDESNKIFLDSLQNDMALNEKQHAAERQRDLSRVGALQNRIDGVHSKIDEAFEGLENLRDIAQVCLDGLALTHELLSSDEDDRSSIQLLGYNMTKTSDQSHVGSKKDLASQQKKPVVKINQKCMSCTDKSGFIMSAFKMACLSYKSSAVVYKGHKFDRSILIEIFGNMLGSCLGDMALRPFFSEHMKNPYLDLQPPKRKKKKHNMSLALPTSS